MSMYSPDLVNTASTSACRTPDSTNNGLASSKDWERIAPPTLKLTPRYSILQEENGLSACRLIVILTLHLVAPGLSTSPSLQSNNSSPQSKCLPDFDHFGLDNREGDSRFRSLTDLKWASSSLLDSTILATKRGFNTNIRLAAALLSASAMKHNLQSVSEPVPVHIMLHGGLNQKRMKFLELSP